MRVFFAVTLDERVKKAIIATQRTVAAVPGARIVPSENLHITLRFLGEVPESDVQSLILRASLVKASPGSILVGGGLSGFPRSNRWTVAVVGIKDDAKVLSTIHNQLPAGTDNKRFVPHITVARSAYEQTELPALHMEPLSMDVDRFVLMESVLRPQGPLYKILHTFPLK